MRINYVPLELHHRWIHLHILQEQRGMEQTFWITAQAQQQIESAGLSLPKILRSQQGCVFALCFGMSRRFCPLQITTEIILANGAILLLRTQFSGEWEEVVSMRMKEEDDGQTLKELLAYQLSVSLGAGLYMDDLEEAKKHYRDESGMLHFFWKPTAQVHWKV